MGYADRIFPLINDLALRKVTPYRSRLLAKAHGNVLELGVGSGLNLEHYDPPRVERIIGVEPDDTMWARAQERAHELRAHGMWTDRASVEIERIDAYGEDLPLADESVDTAVSTFVLCSVRRPSQVLSELHRVVRPGGRLLVMEHVRHPSRFIAGAQRLVTPVWKRCLAGCHPGRKLQEVFAASDWEPVEVDFVELPGLPSIVDYHLVGEYRRS